MLDVACGTGIVARVARERMGPASRIVGVDASPPMLAVARGIDATIDWREGNAMALPVAEGERFSLLTCHQGLQFFPDKTAAVHEMRRVLLPAGRVAIGTWRPLEELSLLRELHPIAEQRLGPVVDARHSFGDAGAIDRLLTDGGFRNVQVETITHDIRMSDGAMFARLNATALASMSEKGKAMNDADRQQSDRTHRQRQRHNNREIHQGRRPCVRTVDEYRDGGTSARRSQLTGSKRPGRTIWQLMNSV